MFATFKMNLSNLSEDVWGEYYIKGTKIYKAHKQRDEKNVIGFAGLLSDVGLMPFIDSCVWGYADDLLKQIDNKYCVSKKNKQLILGGFTVNC